ncbi:hypothetical protein GCM10010266_31290 [Streptomyces griseomycini]|uniref:hypothetical protein n=1 Tax=Streptomyces griseomycini TaxID=66895 RepID=UPI001875F0C9|nr:hypothetical protein [Streptomyces griseomycini]GGQ05656.1 hypothetical protein GCM10010266_31290 [Streptomyces griseomycini]
MDSELAALAASGATTLVSLMVTDSWTHARDLVGRFFSRSGADGIAITDLDTARTRLLAAEATEDTQTTRDITEQWHTYLQRLLQAGSATGDDLRGLLTSLQRIANNSDRQPGTVHNNIGGGVQHGPVIQSGRIAGLTFHVHHVAAPTQD